MAPERVIKKISPDGMFCSCVNELNEISDVAVFPVPRVRGYNNKLQQNAGEWAARGRQGEGIGSYCLQDFIGNLMLFTGPRVSDSVGL